jgi:hypothetical protein
MKRKGIIAVAVVALVLAGRAKADESTTTTQKIIIVTNTVTGNIVTNYSTTSTAVTTTPTTPTANTTYAGGTGDTSSTWSDRWKYDKENHTKFMPNEGSIDLFGTYATRDRFGNGEDGWGGGIGLNYFLTRYVGIGADSYIEEWKVPYRVNGSLLIRLPIDPVGLAPYVFGGGGREWKYAAQWTAHAGAGLEFRLNSHTGIFADARRVFPDKTQDYALWRAGLRLAF